MAKAVATIAEGMSVVQSGRMANRLLAHCRKHGITLSKDVVQEVLKQEGKELAKEQFEALRTRVERRSMIVRHVTVNRNQTPKQVIDATNRNQRVASDVLATMPALGTGTEEVDVYFFRVRAGRYLNAEKLAREYESRGLVPDPYAQAKVNEDDPAFADQYSNGTQWNREGKVSTCLSFSEWGDVRSVDCNRSDNGWGSAYWFGGIRPRTPAVG